MDYPKRPYYQHLVSAPQPSTLGFYYDFDQKKYRPCQAIEWQPYGLYVWRYTDTTDINDTFITCKDSYRITLNKDRTMIDESRIKDESAPTVFHQSMLGEKQWREKLYFDGVKRTESPTTHQKPEFDFLVGSASKFSTPLSEVWIKASAARVVSDIVPGVLMIIYNSQTINGFGYIFIESKRIQPLLTRTK